MKAGGDVNHPPVFFSLTKRIYPIKTPIIQAI